MSVDTVFSSVWHVCRIFKYFDAKSHGTLNNRRREEINFVFDPKKPFTMNWNDHFMFSL